MIQRKSLIVLAVLAAISLASAIAVAAQDVGGKRGGRQLDKNGDGFIDRNESAGVAWLAENFDALDKNKDGKLAPEELPKHGRHDDKRSPDAAPFARLDADKDGRLSRDEAKAEAKLAENFEKMDVNKDGFIDKADFAAGHKQRRDEWFAAADSNKDGMLSKAEYDAAASQPPARFGEHMGKHGRPPKGEHEHPTKPERK